MMGLFGKWFGGAEEAVEEETALDLATLRARQEVNAIAAMCEHIDGINELIPFMPKGMTLWVERGRDSRGGTQMGLQLVSANWDDARQVIHGGLSERHSYVIHVGKRRRDEEED